MTPEKLKAWRPSMAEYHASQAISSGFLARAMSQGLSSAVHSLTEPWTVLTTEPQLAMGTALHAWLSKDTGTKILRAPCTARRGEAWEKWKGIAYANNFDVLMRDQDYLDCVEASSSLTCGPVGHSPAPVPPEAPPEMPVESHRAYEETAAKSEIRAVYKNWEAVPEVSHRWEPEEVPGCVCRIREDIIGQAPGGGRWCAFQIKTTATALVDDAWWPFWRRYYLRVSAFYRAGLRNLFGAEPFRQLLIIVRLVPPYPWRIVDVAPGDPAVIETRHPRAPTAAELDGVWYNELVPELQKITVALESGESHGPEEKGLFS